jgi:cytoskeletal protein CcmA (bactofilin family)
MKLRRQLTHGIMAAFVIGLLWVAGLYGATISSLHLLPTSVDGLTLANYHADPRVAAGLRPLTSRIYADAYRDALGDPPATKWTWYGNQVGGALQADTGALVTRPTLQPTPSPSSTPSPPPSPSPTPPPTPSPIPVTTPIPSPSATPTPHAPAPSPSATPVPSPTATPSPANTVVVAGGQTWNGNLNVSGKSVIIYGTVTGDVTVSGGSLTVYGTAGHDVTVTNGNATINGTIQHNLTVQTGDLFLASTSWVGLNVTVTGGTLTRQSGSYVGGTVAVH